MELWSDAVSSILAVILSLLLLLGMTGNILVAIVTYRRQIQLLPGSLFIRNLAFIDIGGSANLIFMLTTALYKGKWIFGNVGCQINGTLIVFFGSSSLHALWVLSLNRYVKICKPAKYTSVFKTRGNALLVALPWVVPSIIALAPVLGWSSHDYQITKCACHFYFSTDVSYTITFLSISVCIPLGIIAFCYAQIYRTVRAHQISFLQFRRSYASVTNIEDIRSARTIFVIIVAFLLCYAPGSTVNILELAGIIAPPWVDLVSITLIVSKHAQNPLLYGLLNRRYTDANFRGCFDLCLVSRRMVIERRQEIQLRTGITGKWRSGISQREVLRKAQQ